MLKVAKCVCGPTGLALFFALFSPVDGMAQNWLQSSPTGGPTARTEHASVVDPNRQQMIVVGGYASANGQPSSAADVNDAWRLDLGTNQWTALPSLPAAARDSHTAIYDPATTNLTIFGGKTSTAACFNDAWILFGATGASPTWVQVPPGTGPAARGGASAVYDPVSNEMIVFGGRCNATLYNDVWVLENANGVGGLPTWRQVTTSGTPPSARAFHSAAYDWNTNTMTVFGGRDGSADRNDVWVLSNANAIGGTPAWTQLTPYGALPPARETQSAVFDPKLDRLMIFGGSSNGTLVNDAWVLYNANGMGSQSTWVPLTFNGSAPQARGAATAVYDDNSGNLTLFGGDSATVFLNDVWTLQNAIGIGVNTWDGGKPGDRRMVADFDGDGKDDFAVYRPSNATWYVIPSKGGGPIIQQWGLPGDIPVPADWDGDGKADFAVWRPSDGTWYILGSTKVNTYPFSTMQQQWGLPGDIPIVGDFTGDGKIDYTVFRPSNGTWFVLSQTATNTYPAPTIQQQWGLPGDVPVAGNFDTTDRTDFTVFRPSTGTWFVLNPGKTSTYPAPTMQQQWGLPGDVPLVGDFDGDGRTDFAVFRPSNGIWFVLSSADTGSYPFATKQQAWGLPGDVPVIGDFDGDHKADLTVWRPSNATWFVMTSTGPSHFPNANIQQEWGLPGDAPF